MRATIQEKDYFKKNTLGKGREFPRGQVGNFWLNSSRKRDRKRKIGVALMIFFYLTGQEKTKEATKKTRPTPPSPCLWGVENLQL